MTEDPLAPARGCCAGLLMVASLGLLVLFIWAVIPALVTP